MNNVKFLSLDNMLNIASSMVSFFKKAIPIYNDAKPVIEKIGEYGKKLRNIDFNKYNFGFFNQNHSVKKENISNKKEVEFVASTTNSTPQFFL